MYYRISISEDTPTEPIPMDPDSTPAEHTLLEMESSETGDDEQPEPDSTPTEPTPLDQRLRMTNNQSLTQPQESLTQPSISTRISSFPSSFRRGLLI